MKQKIVILFILLGTVSFFMGCQKEERFSSPKIEKSSTIILIVDKQFFEKNYELKSKLQELSLDKVKNDDLSSRVTWDDQNSFYIDTESALFIQEGNQHSYTFTIYEPSSVDIENLVLSYNESTNDYSAYKTSYDLTQEQKNDALNNNYNNGLSQKLVKSIEKIEFNSSTILNRDPIPIYTLPDGRCGRFDHAWEGEENGLTYTYIAYVVVSCPAPTTTNNNPTFFDVDNGGGYSGGIQIIVYDNPNGAGQVYNVDEWESGGGGSFVLADGQIIHFPGTTTLPMVNYRSELIAQLGIPNFGPNARPDLYAWINKPLNENEVKEIYDFIKENGFNEESKLASIIMIDLASSDNLTNFYSTEYENILTNHLSCCGNLITAGVLINYQAHVITEAIIIMETEYNEGHQFTTFELIKILARANLDGIHYGLDSLGLAPGVGVVFDVINGTIYSIEGDWGNATLSLGAAVPLAGQWVTAAKWTKKIVTLANGSRVYLRVYNLASGAIRFSGRSQLRKVLGITDSAIHAHHIIPYSIGEELGTDAMKLIQAAAKSNSVWHINDLYNGIPMPNSLHLSGHSAYTTAIRNKMNQIYSSLSNQNNFLEAYDALMAFCNYLKSQIRFNPSLSSGELVSKINSYQIP